MKQSPEVQKAIAFEKALDDFLAVHKITRSALYELLSIEFDGDKKPAKKSHKKKPAPAKKAVSTPSKPVTKRAPNRHPPIMKIRVFANPHTGKEITVRGNRDGVFNAWNAEYGKDVVKSWLIREEVVPPKSANA